MLDPRWEGFGYFDSFDAEKKTNPKGTVSGYHYQLAVRTRMTQVQFMGYLDNMARAAVVKQNELAKG